MVKEKTVIITENIKRYRYEMWYLYPVYLFCVIFQLSFLFIIAFIPIVNFSIFEHLKVLYESKEEDSYEYKTISREVKIKEK